MTALDPGAVVRALAPHAATHGFPLDEATAIGWHVALTEGLTLDGIPPVTVEELGRAVARHMRSSRFRMVPADAWNLVREERRANLTEQAAAAGDRLLEPPTQRGEIE